jgi:hypothetical protein
VRGEDPNDPADPRNRDRTRESVAHVREILMQWDPIGVAGVPEAADEYDCMISPLMHLLHDGARTRQIRSWIEAEVADHFGMKVDRRRERALAVALTDWWRDRSA